MTWSRRASMLGSNFSVPCVSLLMLLTMMPYSKWYMSLLHSCVKVSPRAFPPLLQLTMTMPPCFIFFSWSWAWWSLAECCPDDLLQQTSAKRVQRINDPSWASGNCHKSNDEGCHLIIASREKKRNMTKARKQIALLCHSWQRKRKPIEWRRNRKQSWEDGESKKSVCAIIITNARQSTVMKVHQWL